MAVEESLAQQEGSSPVNASGYTEKEEWANSISHGLGVIAGILALIFSFIKGQDSLNSVQLFGVIIYCSSIILLFTCSTLYHWVSSPEWKHKLKIADHCAIYFLIAGTYTPLMLIALSGFKANVILISIWSLAFGGVLFKTLFINRFKKFSVVLYLVMGWLCATVMSELTQSMSTLGFQLLLWGGIFYSFGVIFYVGKRIPYNHAIWHLFVLAGAVSHFFCVYLTLI
ncbi:hemolysin III family protein [Shewanella eurypsychrophilus]|uniref:Hemolysin III family protein n=1 Tax=Shewanella eurypsychrophilus TaxID=2593656 RepID=A0ABX6V7R9_9GAMM|nr:MULTISPECIES: hemolysin III family protein [Shewanella]QFU22624.1 hemolysin III family protein [Shewanella sp. YLB-09]QPG57913.1 hemolysin III family protein [Shewanella eurypsychrophilus]